MSENSLRSALKWALNHVVVDEDMTAMAVIEWRKQYAVARAALAATQEPQPHDSRTFEEVIQLHIDSSESMLGVFQRTGDAPGAGMQRGVTAGLKRAIEVYGNWSKRGVAGATAASGRAKRKRNFKVGDIVTLFADVERVFDGENYALKTDGGNHIKESARDMYEIEAAAPRPELAPALPTGNNARYDGLAGNAKWIKESATLSQVEDILRQRADLFADLKKEREAPAQNSHVERCISRLSAYIEHEPPCPLSKNNLSADECICGVATVFAELREAPPDLAGAALTLEDVTQALDYASEGRANWNGVKPDLLGNQLNRVLRQRAAQLKVQR